MCFTRPWSRSHLKLLGWISLYPQLLSGPQNFITVAILARNIQLPMKALADHQNLPPCVPLQLPPSAFVDLSHAKPAEKPVGQQQTRAEPIAFTQYLGGSWAQAHTPSIHHKQCERWCPCRLHGLSPVCEYVLLVFVLDHQTFLSIVASFTVSLSPKFSCYLLKYPYPWGL